jgi:hypothetical protein
LKNEKYKLPTGSVATGLLLRDFEPITTNSAYATLKGNIQIKISNSKYVPITEKKYLLKHRLLLRVLKTKVIDIKLECAVRYHSFNLTLVQLLISVY